MNLCIDQGNSSAKIGIFDNNDLIDSFSVEQFGLLEIEALNDKYILDNCILSSVLNDNQALIELLKVCWPNLVVLSCNTPVPIENCYKTPATLGKDRLAAVVGAAYLNATDNLLVIDAGTAITYDFINAKQQYLGGNIAPGLNLRLKALHHFTEKLPLVEARFDSPLIGDDTESAIVSGCLYGIVYEIEGYINHLKIKYPQLSVFLTGGSTFYFYTKLKNTIFVERNLVLIGLNRILQYNV